MTVSFADLGLTVDFVRKRSRLDFARPRAQTHGATKLFHSAQFAQFINHPMWGCRIELARVGIRQSANVARIFDASGLHSQADPEIGHMLFASVSNRFQHTFNAALA